MVAFFQIENERVINIKPTVKLMFIHLMFFSISAEILEC